jgi:hypothetical protein
LPETCVQIVLTTIALFEVELARREGGTHERRHAGPVRRCSALTQVILGSLATKFFEKFFLIH